MLRRWLLLALALVLALVIGRVLCRDARPLSAAGLTICPAFSAAICHQLPPSGDLPFSGDLPVSGDLPFSGDLPGHSARPMGPTVTEEIALPSS